MKGMNGEVKREHFNHAAAKLIEGLNKTVSCSVFGNIKVREKKDKNKKVVSPQQQLHEMANVLSKKLSPGSAGNPRGEYKNTGDCSDNKTKELNVSGWKAYVVKDFLMSKMRGLDPVLCSKSLLVPMAPSVYETFKKSALKQVDTLISQKYGKLGKSLGPVMAYRSVATCSLSSVDAKTLSKVSAQDVAAAIKSNL
jgi:hypothetical protein